MMFFKAWAAKAPKATDKKPLIAAASIKILVIGKAF
jgi:hypothetical protein